MTILIAEDDTHLRDGIVDLLTLEGIACVTAATGTEALERFRDTRPDLCLLDVVMPGQDGLAVCREIRRLDERVPILLLSARGSEIDRVVGLEIGADDYITKPFGPRELVARVRAALRRTAARPQAAIPRAGRITMDDLELDPAAMRAFRGGMRIDLAAREMAILMALREREGQAVTRDTLFDLCWGRDYMPNSRSLDQYVSALRRKIERDPAAPRIIRTVHGVGYRYDGDQT